MNTCDTCKWWSPGGKRGNPSFGGCDSPMLVTGYGSALNLEPNCAIIESDEGWAIETGPKFGCVHHESKPSIEVFVTNTPENRKLMDDLGFKPIP